MLQTCSTCSRANPAYATYCYYDGLVLGGHSRNGGPVAVGAQIFASAFVFPTGKTCRSFDELALACQNDWPTARDLLRQGYFESFLGAVGRIDLVVAAKEASKFPDRDRGLDQFISQLPSDVLEAPRLAVGPQEINLGVLAVGDKGRKFDLHLENTGMRLLYGSVSCEDGVWLSLGDGPAAAQKHFQFGHELVLPVRVVGDRLRAANKPLVGRLVVESNGGTATVTVRAQVPVKPFSEGVLAGATTPRKVAEKAKTKPKEAASLFESGAVAAWYKSNGWTYPVQGPAASGLAAVQQFFEALGLTPAPKVQISVQSVRLAGNPGDPLRCVIEVKTEEKKPIYAHGVSNQPWLEVGRPKVNGRLAAVPLSVPAVPNKPGQQLKASVTVQSNGNQRFVVPVTLEVGGSAFNFDEPAAEVAVEPEVIQAVEAAVERPARPAPSPQIQAAPPAPAYSPSYRRPSKPLWVHALPALLLGLALFIVVVADLLTRAAAPVQPSAGGPPDVVPLGLDPESWKFADLKSADPKLGLRFNEAKRFGLVMLGVKDPRPEYPGKFKKITFDEVGGTNNTIVNIEGYEYYFGEKQGDNRLIYNKDLLAPRHGNISVMDYPHEKVKVKQHVEVTPGQTGLLDTCLVWYHIENYGESPIPVGLRFMLDTYIGANDGVPFTAPGVKGFIKDMREFKGIEIPPYLEVVERPDDPKDPGTVVRMGLKNINLPGVNRLEDPDVLRITHFPPQQGRQRWEVPLDSIQDANGGDSCVALYWPYDLAGNAAVLPAKSTRDMAFTYGLSQLDISTGGNAAVALSTPDAVPPETDFIVTARVYNAGQGDEVELTLPTGLTFVRGETAKKTVEEAGKVAKVEWKIHAGSPGIYPIRATSGGFTTKPHDVVVKSSSIFG